MTQYSYHDRTVSQFMVQRGDHESSSSQQEGSSTTRTRLSRNIVPVEVRQLLQHSEEEGPLYVHGLEVGLVVIVGQVRSVDMRETNTSYMVEDRTGRIEVLHWNQDHELETQTQPVGQNTLVKVIGVLQCGREQPLVTAYRFSTVLDMAEADAHLLEISLLPLRLRKMQMRAASLAQASFYGNSGIGVRHLPTQMLPSYAVNTHPSHTMKTQPSRTMLAPSPRTIMSQAPHTMMVPSPRTMAPLSRMTMAPRKTMMSMPSQSGDWLSPALRCKASYQTAATPMDPAAAQLLGFIKSNSSEMGITRRELRTRVTFPTRLEMMLDYLAQEGHVYTTCDQDHFKATDA